METYRKVIFWFSVVVAIIVVLFSTFLQMLPIALYIFFAYETIWQKRDYRIFLMVLALIMALLNLSISSGLDVVYWILAFSAFVK
jgi:hypothetical protein